MFNVASKGSVISKSNSTYKPLASGRVWLGGKEDVEHFTSATVSIHGNQAISGTLYLEKSIDGSNWIRVSRPISDISTQVNRPHIFTLTERWFRVSYENGSTDQTFFQLETKFHTSYIDAISAVDGNTVDKGSEAVYRQIINDHRLDIARGKFVFLEAVHKFGATIGISSSTDYRPISIGETYPTPQVGSVTTLRVKAGNAADDASGAGARSVIVDGLDATGAEQSVTLTTAGEAAGSASSATFLRAFRAYLGASGSYATVEAGSHTAAVVIENSAGTADWLTIGATGHAKGQSQCGWYTVPLGVESYLKSYALTVDGVKAADFAFFQRQNILETAAPYTPMRLVVEHLGVTSEFERFVDVPFGPYPALTDLGWMAKGSTTPNVSCEYELINVTTS